MYELRQPPTSFGVANETLDDTIIINENRQENADYHMMTGGLEIVDYHILSTKTFDRYELIGGGKEETKPVFRKRFPFRLVTLIKLQL